MPILDVVTATDRALRHFNALDRLVEENQRQFEQLTRLIDIPAIRQFQEQAAAMAEPVRRAQEQLEALTGPTRRLQERLESLGNPTRELQEQLASFQASTLTADQIKMFEPPQALLEQFAAITDPRRGYVSSSPRSKHLRVSWRRLPRA